MLNQYLKIRRKYNIHSTIHSTIVQTLHITTLYKHKCNFSFSFLVPICAAVIEVLIDKDNQQKIYNSVVFLSIDLR